MKNKTNLYHAIVFLQQQDSQTFTDLRVHVWAETLDEGLRKLEIEHGKGNIYDFHNAEDADKPR